MHVSCRFFGVALLAVVAMLPRRSRAADVNNFASQTVDLGIVVSDVAKAVKFYTDVVGFKEIQGFEVGAEFCTDAG